MTAGQARGGLLQEMWRRFWGYERLIFFLVAMTTLDAAAGALVVLARNEDATFTSIARSLIEGTTLPDAIGLGRSAGSGVWAAVAFAVAGSALWDGWLRAGFLLGLGGRGATLRPPLRIVGWLAAYQLVFGLAGLGLSALGDHGLALLALFGLLAVGIAGLFADYAVALAGRTLPQGIADSLRLMRPVVSRSASPVRRTLAATALAVWVVTLVLVELASSAFAGSADSTLRPTSLVGFVLATALVQYITDVALVTIYLREDEGS